MKVQHFSLEGIINISVHDIFTSLPALPWSQNNATADSEGPWQGIKPNKKKAIER